MRSQLLANKFNFITDPVLKKSLELGGKTEEISKSADLYQAPYQSFKIPSDKERLRPNRPGEPSDLANKLSSKSDRDRDRDRGDLDPLPQEPRSETRILFDADQMLYPEPTFYFDLFDENPRSPPKPVPVLAPAPEPVSAPVPILHKTQDQCSRIFLRTKTLPN